MSEFHLFIFVKDQKENSTKEEHQKRVPKYLRRIQRTSKGAIKITEGQLETIPLKQSYNGKRIRTYKQLTSCLKLERKENLEPTALIFKRPIASFLPNYTE